jgi:23S rRNA (cytosine1962-C5)-methyltransferase
MTYQLLDAGDFAKLEQVGPWRLVRPAAQAVWRRRLDAEAWGRVDAVYERFRDGKGEWHRHRHRHTKDDKVDKAGKTDKIDKIDKIDRSDKSDNNWTIDLAGVRLRAKLTSFGHLGLFAEQSLNWQELRLACGELGRPHVLNLFAYTGAASIACAQGGAEVTHIDASKGTVDWARQNFELNGLAGAGVRFMVDDAVAFAAREGRRGKKYDGVILDPPTYGRGPDKQLWKIEEHLLPLLDQLRALLNPRGFVLLSCHSPGYTPLVVENLLKQIWAGAAVEAREMGIVDAQGVVLPSGVSGFVRVNF